MYAVYKYIAGATATNICNDVILMLTGTTDPNDLSASCDKPNTSILTTWCAAGWTLHDASAGTNAQCIRSPWPDDPTKDAYVVVDTNTAGAIYTKAYETWNEITHVGTNACSGTTSYYQRLNVATGGTLYISASPTHFIMYCYVGSQFGSSSYNSATGIVFRTRRNIWDTVINGYPPFSFVLFSAQTGTFICYGPRTRYYASATDTTGSGVQGYGAIMGFCSNEFAAITNSMVGSTGAYYTWTANQTQAYAFFPISTQVKLNYGWLGGDISSSSCLYVGQCMGVPLDIYTNGPGGAEYVMWGMNSNSDSTMPKLCVRRG